MFAHIRHALIMGQNDIMLQVNASKVLPQSIESDSLVFSVDVVRFKLKKQEMLFSNCALPHQSKIQEIHGFSGLCNYNSKMLRANTLLSLSHPMSLQQSAQSAAGSHVVKNLFCIKGVLAKMPRHSEEMVPQNS